MSLPDNTNVLAGTRVVFTLYIRVSIYFKKIIDGASFLSHHIVQGGLF